MDGKLWGGFLDNSSNFTSPFLLSFDDVEKLSKAGYVPPSKSLKTESAMTTQMMPISYFDSDPITKHNIQLVQYSKQMEELLLQLQHSYLKTSADSIPLVPIIQTKQHIPQDPSIKLTRRGVQQLLHKSAFTICAHEGFDSTTESVLATLVDVADEMLVKFCNLLKVNTEREMLNQSTGFTDAMERTLHDMGMNGVKDLHLFHVNRVLRYNDRLRSQAEQLRRACVTAASQWTGGSKAGGPATPWEDPEWTEWSGNEAQETEFSFKKEGAISRNNSTSSEAVNQLHLEDNAVISAPGLEPGLRMLHTLEQQEASGSNAGRLPHLILMEDDGGSVSPANYASVESITSPTVYAAAGKHDPKKKRKT